MGGKKGNSRIMWNFLSPQNCALVTKMVSVFLKTREIRRFRGEAVCLLFMKCNSGCDFIQICILRSPTNHNKLYSFV